MEHFPGEIDVTVPPPPPTDPNDPLTGDTKCSSIIDRTSKDSHFTLTLKSGKICKFTRENFPPNRSWPVIIGPNGVNKECADAIGEPAPTTTGDPKNGGCYAINGGVALQFNITLDIACGCDLEGWRWSTITLKAP